MMRLKFSLAIIATFFLTSCSNVSKESLFEENASNWMKTGDTTWEFENNHIIGTADSTTGFIQTNKIYKDFILNLEFKPDSTINSGIFVRCNNDAISATNCYEINIWDLHPNQDNRTGSIVARVNPFERVETLNKWNTYKIECKGNHIKAWVNDTLTAELTNTDLSKGKIALQAAGNGKIEFRNVTLKSIE